MRNRSHLRTGGAAVVMITLMLLLSLIVIGILAAAANRPMLASREVEGDQTFYAADSALQLALREIMLGIDEDGDGSIGTITDLSGSIFGATDVHVTRTDSDGEITLTAHGMHDDVSRHLRIRSLFTSGQDAGGGGVPGYPGLAARAHPVNFAPSQLSQIPWHGPPNAVAITPDLNWPGINSNSNPFWSGGQSTNYGVRFTGLIRIEQPGVWWFRTNSDDGSRLWIGEDLVVNNDGLHAMQTRDGSIALEAGFHPFEIQFFERAGNHGLIASWRPPNGAWHVIPSSVLLHTGDHIDALPPLLVARDRLILSGRSAGQHCGITGSDLNGATVQINATAPQSVSVVRGFINGSVRVGPGGDPQSVVHTGQHGSVNGPMTTAAHLAAVLRTVAPFPGLPGSSGSVNLLDGNTHVMSNNFRMNSLRIRDSTLRIDGHVTGYIGGTLELEGNGRILVSAGSSLRLQVAGEIRAGDDARIEIADDNPDRVRLEIIGNHRMFIRRNFAMTGRIVAPDAEIRFESGNPPNRGHLRGSVFANQIELHDMASIHLVRATTQSGGPEESGPPMVTIFGWDQPEESGLP